MRWQEVWPPVAGVALVIAIIALGTLCLKAERESDFERCKAEGVHINKCICILDSRTGGCP